MTSRTTTLTNELASERKLRSFGEVGAKVRYSPLEHEFGDLSELGSRVVQIVRPGVLMSSSDGATEGSKESYRAERGGMTSLDNESAKLILQSLIERLAADSESLTPQFGALISQTDRAALQHLLGTSTLSPKAAEDNTAGADSTTLVEDVLTQGIPAGSPQSAIVLSPSAYADLNLSCLKATGVQTNLRCLSISARLSRKHLQVGAGVTNPSKVT